MNRPSPFRDGCLALVLSSVALGCGWSEDKYFNEHAKAECVYRFDCSTDAQLELWGWDTVEDCVPDIAGIHQANAAGCDSYDAKAAKACVSGYDSYTCPDPVDDPFVPAQCEAVFTSCDDGGGDTDR